jgi:diguanylate cyclase (GGDEF)-like protein/PAS domain S-box-containing protein
LASVLLGVMVLVAWHWQFVSLLQVIPGTPPIRYNVGLAFAFSGLALMLLQSQRWRLALVPASFVLALGGLTLVQYVAGVDLGIDELFMTDYLTKQLDGLADIGLSPEIRGIRQFFVTVEAPLPGRSSPNTALAFTLVGVALVSLGLSPPFKKTRLTVALPLAGIVAGGVLGVGAIALLGYLAPLSSAYTWRYLTGISILGSLGLVMLGTGLLTYALGNPERWSLTWWVPLSLGFGVVMASVFLWQVLLNWHLHSDIPLPGLVNSLEGLMKPLARLVLFEGLGLALLFMAVLYVAQGLQEQTIRLKQLNQVLEHTRGMLDATLHSTADSILVVDISGRVVYYNRRLTHLWGLPATQVQIGGPVQHLWDWLVPQLKDPEVFGFVIQHTLTAWDQRSFDVLSLKDGRVLECHGLPYEISRRMVGKVLNFREVTERYRAEAALRDSETLYRSLLATMAEGVLLQDASGAVLTCNRSAEDILGLSLDQMQGRTAIDPRWRCLREDGSRLPMEQHPARVSLPMGQPCRNAVVGIEKPNGNLTWILVNTQPLVEGNGDSPYAVVVSFTDITERRDLESALFQEKELAQVTLQSIGDGVITTDVAGHITYVNPMAEALIGWSQAEAMGQLLKDLFTLIEEDTRVPVPNPVDLALAENRPVNLHLDRVLINRSGREIAINDSAAPIRDRQGQTVGAVLVFKDVTQERQLSRQVSWQAKHDSLTGLINRREFEQRLGEAFQSVRALQEHHVLFYLDLDQFKIVNDTCGHHVGDELLRQVATLLQSRIRKTDTLARLGGDEFGVLLHHCHFEEALWVANTLRESLQTFRFVWQGSTFTVGVSIGLVAIDGQIDGLEQLLIAADSACYAAKSSGRNRVHVYHPDDATLLIQQRDMRWFTRLTEALEANRFCLFAQPIVATATGSGPPTHYEVLLRLRDERGALVPPGMFLPAAEVYGLMVSIDRWVITTLFQHWHEIQSVASPCLYAINLSGSSINDDQMIDFLRHSLEHYGVPAHQVCFEITETMAITNLMKANQFVQQLHAMGCRFALDDFGSGMSSFTYLKHLPVDYLKIDGGFVKDMLTNPVDEAMVEAINRIGQVMGIETIAEYVENSAILNRLAAMGVDFAQGYGIAKPTPLIPLPSPSPSPSPSLPADR